MQGLCTAAYDEELPELGPLLARRDGRDEFVEDEQAVILRLHRTPPLDLTRPLAIVWREGEIW